MRKKVEEKKYQVIFVRKMYVDLSVEASSEGEAVSKATLLYNAGDWEPTDKSWGTVETFCIEDYA